MAEIIISAIISLVCIAPIIILGIVQYRSKNPVGFWSGKEPPEKERITDVKAYNQKHGMMWIVYGAGFILCYVCGVPFGGGAAAVLCIIEVTGGMFGMIAYHNKLDRVYYKKGEDI
ncbi:MAG: hypothetical protein HFG66_06415 [Hungatella sp.]|jgi:hypothetical protein|nr:hypothetical protein [Hungatella sp.]